MNDLERKIDEKGLEVSQRGFEKSVQVQALINQINEITLVVQQNFDKHSHYESLFKKKPTDTNAELLAYAARDWIASTEQLKILNTQLDNQKVNVLAMAHLLFMEPIASSNSEISKTAVRLFEQGRYSELENLLNEEARELEKSKILKEQQLLDEKKKDFSIEDALVGQAIKINRKPGDQERFDKAKRHFERSIEIWPFFVNHYAYADLIEGQDIVAAIRHYKLALKYINDDFVEQADTFSALSHCYSAIFDAKKAKKFKEQEISFYRKRILAHPSEKLKLARALSDISIIYQNHFEFTKAAKALNEAERYVNNLNDIAANPAAEALIAMILENRALLYVTTVDYKNAELAYQTLNDFVKDKNIDQGLRIKFDINLAHYYLTRNQAKKAESLYGQILNKLNRNEKFEPADLAFQKVFVLEGLATVYSNTGRREHAFEMLEDAENLCRYYLEMKLTQFKPSLAQVLMDKGLWYIEKKKARAAEIILREAETIWAEIAKKGTHVGWELMVNCKILLAEAFILLQDYKSMRDTYVKTIEFLNVMTTNNDNFLRPQLALVQSKLADACQEAHMEKTAKKFFKNAVDNFRQFAAAPISHWTFRYIDTALEEIGNLTFLNHFTLANQRLKSLAPVIASLKKEHFEKYLDYSYQYEAGVAIRLMHQRKFQTSKFHLDKALSLSERLTNDFSSKHIESQANIWRHIGYWYSRQSHQAQAIAAFEKGIQLYEATPDPDRLSIARIIALLKEVIGDRYALMEDPDKQIEYYLSSFGTWMHNGGLLSQYRDAICLLLRKIHFFYYKRDEILSCLNYAVKERAFYVLSGEQEKLNSINHFIEHMLSYCEYDKAEFEHAMEQQVLATQFVYSLHFTNM